MSDEKNLRSLVNSSGFLFQLRVAHEVETTKSEHDWEVIAEELPWQDQHSGRGGYIDLVLGKGLMRMVIECKRVKEGAWVFLLPNTTEMHKDVLLARCMWVRGPNQLPIPQSSQEPIFRSGWFNFYPQPSSYMAEFCVVRGTGEDDKPMLERIAGQLVGALEALAVEEIMLSLNSTPGQRYVYVPIIVTNADLQVCRFKSDEVDLSTGRLSEGEFESVPFIRFHKSLTTQLSPELRPSRLQAAHQDKMRTVLVVNSAYLTKLLEEWHFGKEYQPPW